MNILRECLRADRQSAMMSTLRHMRKNLANVTRQKTTAESGELLARARGGDGRALSTLFRRQGDALLDWARGRLPPWARAAADTVDMVQDALLQTFRRIDVFENRGKGALGAFLRQAVLNRIRDEMRKVARHPLDDLGDAVLDLPARGPSPFQVALDAEKDRKYKQALATLTDDERLLVVGRMELDFNYEQLAVASKRATAEAARQAVRRAVLKVAERMSGA